MGETLLNGREATDFELAAVAHGRECELRREREQLKGLLSEYPRAEVPGCRPRHVSDIEVDFATARRRP
jgi:peroxiredoxin